jgi:hypothetical protein
MCRETPTPKVAADLRVAESSVARRISAARSGGHLN